MLEADGRSRAFRRELPDHLGADPFLRSVGHLPHHALLRRELEHLHVEEPAVAELKMDHAADLALPAGVVRPPAGEALARRDGGVDVARRSLDAHAVHDVEHCRTPSRRGAGMTPVCCRS
jgi:hypothetical protein